MAELAASVAGLLSLTITVVDISHRYFSSAKNATRTVKAYFRELEALKLLLADLKALGVHDLPDVTVTALEGCHGELQRLRSKLQKRTTGSAFSTAIHRLSWPFAEEETRHLIEVIHRYLDIFHVALSSYGVGVSTATLDAVQSVAARVIDVERQNILRSISHVNPLSNHLSARDKHDAHTGQWLIKSTEFVQWHQENHRSLWLTGIPGAGKTVLCSTAIDFLQRTQNVNEPVFIFYFDFSDDQKQSLEALHRSLLRQACDVLDTIPADVVEVFGAARTHRRQQSPDRQTLTGLLSSVFKTLESVTILIDALDESSEVSAVLNFLQELKSERFENVRWLVTSRRREEIESSLTSIGAAVVPLDNAFVDADIRHYVKECLLRDPKLCTKPANVKKRIEDVLAEKAHGMFRWVECQLEALRKCRTAPGIEAALSTLPETLDATYERILQSIAESDREHARRTLELLAFSKRPLRVEEVAEAITVVPGCKPFNIDDRFFDPSDVVLICAGLIKRVQDTNELILAHHSVQEFLFSARILHSNVADFGIHDRTSQTRLAETCLTYLLSFEDGSTYHGIEDDFPFLHYAARNWLNHIPVGSTDSRSVLTSLLFAFMTRWQQPGSFDWSKFCDAEVFYHYEFPQQASPVNVVCLWGRYDVALSLVESGLPLHSHGGDCWALWRFVVHESDLDILKRIVVAGCNVCKSPSGESLLSLAAYGGKDEIVAELLKLDVEVQTSSSTSDTKKGMCKLDNALHASAEAQNKSTTKLLLAAGADINASEPPRNSPLTVLLACSKFHARRELDFAEFLIQSGADVNGNSNHDFDPPLHSFLSRFFPGQYSPMLHPLSTFNDFGNFSTRCETVVFNLAFTLRCHQKEEAPPKYISNPNRHSSASIQSIPEILLAHLTAMVQLLLSSGADPNSYGSLYPAQVRTEAMRLLLSPDVLDVRELIDAGANLDLLGPDKGTLLQAACSLPFEANDIVVALLKFGADPSRYDHQEESPLRMAILRGYETVVKTLVDAGAESLPRTEPEERSKILDSNDKMLAACSSLIVHS